MIVLICFGSARSGRRIDSLRDYAVDLWRGGLTIEEVASQLSEGAESHGLTRTPHENTIKAWVRGLTRDGREPWRLSSATAEEAALVRPLADYLVRALPNGWPTARQARWAMRIGQLVPGLSGRELYRVAVRFIAAEDAGDLATLRELEYLVLTNPWEPRTPDRGAYLDLVDQGTIRGEWFTPGAAGVAREAPYYEDPNGQLRRVAAVLKARREKG
jgi:hypothetical protein